MVPPPPGGPNDVPCPNCKHPRSAHSRNGCLEWLPDMTECPCKRKYTDF